MGQSWALSRTEDPHAVVNDGIAAGLGNEDVKPDDPRVMAATEIIGSGESTTITFSISELDPAGDYQFYCRSPGHCGLMKRAFRVE